MVASPCDCAGPGGHAGRRVVLTGGPGAGKTAVLEVVRKHLCDHVEVLPEAAGIVYGGGFPRRGSLAARRAAQLAIFHVQDQLEDLAVSDTLPALVLCDRGILDGLAYWPDEPASFFRATGLTREAMLRRYDAVIHLRTPGDANGYNHRNPLRTESAAEAARIDLDLLEFWSGHPRRHVIESTADFLDKLTRTLTALRAELPGCCQQHSRFRGTLAPDAE